MPKAVRLQVGVALGFAQRGSKHPSAKPWKGEGPGVFEIVSHVAGNAFRAVFAVRFSGAVYVLHCFNKKSPSGIKTSRTDIALISRRLKVAREDYEARNGQTKI
jgi:phage-related protein